MGFPSGSLGTRNHGSDGQLNVGRALPAIITCGAQAGSLCTKGGGHRGPPYLTFHDLSHRIADALPLTLSPLPQELRCDACDQTVAQASRLCQAQAKACGYQNSSSYATRYPFPNYRKLQSLFDP